MPQDRRFVVITGGPGSGKSTLVEALAQRGHARTPEAGRGVIVDQVGIGGSGVPWRDEVLFAELMLSWELRSYRWAQSRPGVVFFDRGMPDLVGFLRVRGREVPAHVDAAARGFGYRREVFLAPFWPEIYGVDAERGQSPEEAEATFHAMVEAYTEYGYRLLVLPKSSVADRVDFVLDALR
ncbi:AAA family ATPase [Saccharopolyspora sp. CA-218241]|uniref:AAA family ATPase n=1 Tax=Saccharopolyspora sp. CA-218241 TaxID=3240027 RepID=UPI003D9914C1